MQTLEVRQYVAPDGKIPFREWLLALTPVEARARIRVRIDRLRLGSAGDCRTVGRGVMELRFHFGPGYRVYFGKQGKQIILLLCGGDKKSQKKDIRTAMEYWHDYKRSHG